MRTALVVVALSALATPALAQPVTLTPSTHVVGVNATASITIEGVPGRHYALVSSATNTGLSYGGLNLAVGTDVQILSVGTLNGTGQAIVTVNPPFAQRDRHYLQAVTAIDPGFTVGLVASNGIVIVNRQEAQLYMPVGGAVSAAGALVVGSPGVTVSKAGSTYTLSHPNQFNLPSVLPSITPMTAGVFITSLTSTQDQTVVTFTNDSGFSFILQPVRR